MDTLHTVLIVGGRQQTTTTQREWTVRQYAEREQVAPMTVRRWIAKGALVVRRNVGGGIRIIGERP